MVKQVTLLAVFIAGELGVNVLAVASARETTAPAGVPATGASGMTEAIDCPCPVATRWTFQGPRATDRRKPNRHNQRLSTGNKRLQAAGRHAGLDDPRLPPPGRRMRSAYDGTLGVPLEFSLEEERRIQLCRLAYRLAVGDEIETRNIQSPFKTTTKEKIYTKTSAIWNEIVSLKRPAGIPLGGGFYLKEIGSGDIYLTSKQVSLVGALQSKKVTMSSIQKATRYIDGLLLNRSSGKSVFLAADLGCSIEFGEFALIAEHLVSGEPVLGHDPTDSFIPKVQAEESMPVAELVTPTSQSSTTAPRYTFRVVGDHVDNRAVLIAQLQSDEPLTLRREPSNKYDSNAIAVFSAEGQQLG